MAIAVGLAPGCSKKATLARHLTRANRYYGEKRFEEASLEYINVLQADPNQPLALERLGGIYFDRGQTSQALALLMKARELGSHSELATLQLARLHLLKGRIDEGRKLAIALLDQAPGNEQAILLLADAIRDEGQLNDTIQRLQAFQKRNGEKVVHVGFGKLALRTNDLKQAEIELLRAQQIEPNSSAMHLALATLRWQQGDLKVVDEHFQKAAELAPENWSTGLIRADFKLLTGAPAEARKAVEAVQQRTPQNIAAWLVLARIAVSEKKYDECLDLIKKVEQAGGSDPQVQLLQAQVNLAKGDTRQAITDLERLCEQFPKVPQFHYHLALAYLKSGQLAKGTMSVKQAAKLDPKFEDAILLSSELAIRNKEFPEAVSALSGLLKTTPRAERAYPLLVGAFQGQGALESALAACQQWKQSFPKSPQAPFFTGLIRLRQQKTNDARAAFEEAVALAPTLIQPVQATCRSRRGRKEFPERPPPGPTTRQSGSESAPAQILLAEVYLAQGASDEAEAALLKALELDPASATAGMLLAQLYVRSNKSEQAIEKLTAVIAKNPKDWQSMLVLGLLQQKKRDFAAARATYEKVVQLNPKNAAAYNNLAYICEEQFNDLDAALAHAQKARELASDDPSIADTLGWVLVRRQDYAKALPLLVEAAEHQPSNPEVQFHLGLAQSQMGQEEAARANLQRALQLAQDFPGKPVAERRVWILNLNPSSATAEDVTKLQGYLADDPANVNASLKMAAISDRDGQTQKALAFYQAAVKANPKSPALLLALARFFDERLHERLGRSSRLNSPRNSRHGIRLSQNGWPSSLSKPVTLAGLTLSSKAWPNNRRTIPRLFCSLALASYARGRIPEAQAAMRQALGINPSFSRAALAKKFLEVLELSEDPARAVLARKQIEQLLQAEPNNVPAWMALATIREHEGQFADARKIYEDNVLKIYPDFAPAQRRLALLYANHLSDDTKSLDFGMKARDVFKDDPDLNKALGQAALRRKEYAKAVPLLNEAIDKRPNEADLYYSLGMAYQGLERKDLCKRALRQALDLHLETGLAQEASRVLGQLK